MKAKKLTLSVLIFSLLFSTKAFSLSLYNAEDWLSGLFGDNMDVSEGETTFRSLLIPCYAKAESLGEAFTGMSDDIGFLDYNPGASSVLNFTQFAFFHNQWIADSALDQICFTTRIGNLGLGGYAKCFYVPFTEYNAFGIEMASDYYSETTGCFNISYNFLPGYTFKGIAAGINLKGSYRSIPDFFNDETGTIEKRSGLAQSGFAFMADAGVLLRFNLAKFYSSREPNLRVGISAQNLGVAFTGLGDSIRLDDGLPTVFAAGLSYTFIKPITVTADFKMPFNLMKGKLLHWYSAAGIEFKFTDYFSLLGGFAFKGSNPRFSLGAQFEIERVQFNLNYSLDMTSSFTPLNRISLSAKLILGDRGRLNLQRKIDSLYQEGLVYYVKSCKETDGKKALEFLDLAIAAWEEILVLDPTFDPAKQGVGIIREEKLNLEKVQREQQLE